VTPLRELEQASIFVVREAFAQFRRPAVLWSTGKDSTALLHLCRKAFLGRVPFPVIHLDTSYKFPDMYAFRDGIAREWGLDLVVARNDEALAAGVHPDGGALACCTALKTETLKRALAAGRHDAVLLAIRRDEHGIRAKERVFSPRADDSSWRYGDQPLEMWDLFTAPVPGEGHVRVHPILGWREVDVWRYVRDEGLPFNPRYLSRDGLRYRSLGCEPCTRPVASPASTLDAIVEELETSRQAERSGRLQDKERAFMMQKLRAMGYM
jgi:sulfate adenylyltransferase subunit 2